MFLCQKLNLPSCGRLRVLHVSCDGLEILSTQTRSVDRKIPSLIDFYLLWDWEHSSTCARITEILVSLDQTGCPQGKQSRKKQFRYLHYTNSTVENDHKTGSCTCPKLGGPSTLCRLHVRTACRGDPLKTSPLITSICAKILPVLVHAPILYRQTGKSSA